MPDDQARMKPPRLFLAWPSALALVATLSGCNRPAPVPAAPPPPPAAAPAPPPLPAREPGAYETPRPPIGREPTPLPNLTEDAPAASTPLAGRQVMRCLDKGRITYVDLNAPCADGPGERVTVFPTAGVEKPR